MMGEAAERLEKTGDADEAGSGAGREPRPDARIDLADLSSSPSHLLHRAQQFAADCFADAMQGLAAGAQLTQRQFAVLNAVAANEGLTQTDLVRATGIDRSTLAELVARMAARGLLSRSRDARDARANAVRLTAAGRRALAQTAPRVVAADRAITAVLSSNKQKAFIDALQRLDQALSAPPTPAKPAAKGKATEVPETAPASAKGKAKTKKAKTAKEAKVEKKADKKTGKKAKSDKAEKGAKADKRAKGGKKK